MRIPLLILALLSAVVASADECVPTTSEPDVTSDDGRHYVDNDLCQPDCIFALWIYEESNGIEGLQRNDENHDDTCAGVIDSDTLVF